MAAILLIGLGGQSIWQRSSLLPQRWRGPAAGLVLLVLLVPALQERRESDAVNTQFMERTQAALDADGDARTILAALKGLPAGRTYAGLRANWGANMALGDLRFTDLLTFNQIEAVSPPTTCSTCATWSG